MNVKFDDGKDVGALRTIGEVSAALGIKTHVLRYWEQQFSVLQPLKRSGRRYYRSDDIMLVQTIDRLVNHEGYTLKGAQQALKNAVISHGDDDHANRKTPGAPQVAAALAPEPAKPIEAQKPEVPADVIAQIKAIRVSLAAAIA